ncbi:MAG: cbb3-type cytochrome c oxidase subunit 3 [bacterium]
MISNYLSTIDGVSIFPVIALLLFFSLFVGLLIWTFRIDKSYLKEMQNLPLDIKDELIKNSEIKNGQK